MNKKIRSVLVIVALVGAVGPIASAQNLAGTNAQSDNAPKQQLLIGSWLETVTFPPETGRPSLKSLGSYNHGGTMTCSDQGTVTTTEPPSVFTSCHGVWTHVQDRTFAYTSLGLISDLSGNLVGYLKVRGTYTVSESGNEYSGTSHATVVDTDDNVLFSTDVTNSGRRIQIDLP